MIRSTSDRRLSEANLTWGRLIVESAASLGSIADEIILPTVGTSSPGYDSQSVSSMVLQTSSCTHLFDPTSRYPHLSVRLCRQIRPSNQVIRPRIPVPSRGKLAYPQHFQYRHCSSRWQVRQEVLRDATLHHVLKHRSRPCSDCRRLVLRRAGMLGGRAQVVVYRYDQGAS